jgi:hypothetical protein
MLLPITMLWGLKIQLAKKVAVIVLLALSGV